MDPNLSHTPLRASPNDSSLPAENPPSPQQTPSASAPTSPPPQNFPIPISTGTTKEAGPSRSTQEVGSEQESSEEQSAEMSQEEEKKTETIRHRKDIPDIHPDAAKAGLQVAPSASQFPTIYDVKVPVYKDEQILENLHKNFWTGARWLAELCKYILWQAHIRLRKVGNKIVRERIPERT